jgi:hypothetical protein
MFIRSALACSLLLISAAACGGDDDGVEVVDGGGSGADGGGVAGQIGVSCTMEMPCPGDLPVCAVLEEGATAGFCTKVCGTSPVPPMGMMPVPPAGGNATCQAGYTGTATAGCVLTFPPDNQGNLPWGCALACGATFGTCPDNLECVVMKGEDGFCFPP